MKIKVVFTLLLSLTFLTACGGGGGGDDKKKEIPGTVLEGSWVDHICKLDSTSGYYYRDSSKIVGNSFSDGTFNFSDSLCTAAISHRDDPTSGTFTIGDTVLTHFTNVNASKIDIIGHIENFDFDILGYDIFYLDDRKLFYGDVDSNPSYDGTTDDKRPFELVTNDYWTKFDANLQGYWVGNCRDSGNGDGSSVKISFNIFADLAKVSAVLYSDSACTIFSENNNLSYILELGDSVTASGLDATELNTFIGLTQDEFDIYHVSNGILYLGDSDSDINYDGTTAEKRPIALDLVNYYTKSEPLTAVTPGSLK